MTRDSPHADAPDPAADARPHVLVVDDHCDGADSLGVLLQLAGLRVTVAYRGSEALEALRRERPACAVIDISLPDMDGLTLATLIRLEHGNSAPRLAALTGWAREEDRERSRAAGFERHFVKPVDSDELVRWLAAPRPLL